MCGILGLVGDAPARRPAFERALDTIRHRGPDDHGILDAAPTVRLGARRLAILDLTPAGHQPMVDDASGCALVYNGEIYNAAELRAELQSLGHHFRGHGDTEVLLRAYLAWGEACLARCNGMWAFALWDPRRRHVLLARDRFGVKPLYYADRGGVVAFASEPKALLALDPALRAVDERTLTRFIAYSELYVDDRTFYRDVRLLPPGHLATVPADAPRVRQRRWWSLAAATPPGGCTAASREALSALLDDAVRIRQRADVPVGLSLSGGIDSSAVLRAMTGGGGGDLTCLTAVYGDGAPGELAWARRAAEACGARLEAVDAPKADWLSTLRTITWHMDAPGYSPAVYPMWRIMGAARDLGLKVMLEGQGADEAFGGYPQYASVALRDLARRGRVAGATRGFLRAGATFGVARLALWMLRDTFPAGLAHYRRRFAGASLLRAGQLAALDPEPASREDEAAMRDASPLTRRLFRDFTRDVLPGLLHYGDAVSMGRSVESRLPFMDYRVAEWAFAAPDACKLDGGETKVALRDHLRRHGLPDIAGRRDKQGYPTPVAQWLRDDDGAIPRRLLLSDDALIAAHCDRGAMAALVNRHVAGASLTTDTLYKLVSTETWLRTCIAGDGSPPGA